jgi:phospholipase C
MSAPDTGSGPADATSHSNSVIITDGTGTIQDIVPIAIPGSINPSVINQYGVGITAKQPCSGPQTVSSNGAGVFTINLDAGRSKTSAVANVFNQLTGGSAHEFVCNPRGGDSQPSELNFFFEVQLSIQTPSGQQILSVYLGQGSYVGGNNWWIGGSCVSYDGYVPTLQCPGMPSLVLGGVFKNNFTFLINYPIFHVFVLMLENHSFDNMLAMSGIDGIDAATDTMYNSYNGTPYYVGNKAQPSMTTDPGHEFLDVMQQFTGLAPASWKHGQPYPAINNSGFASNYATTTTEGPIPSSADIGDIMQCFPTATALPVLYQLATEFVVCDQWYSSLPGPTWPNRFFVHGASSNGLDHSPGKPEMAKWLAPNNPAHSNGFHYPNQSIFQVMIKALRSWRAYIDTTGTKAGSIAQVASLQDVSLIFDVDSLDSFPKDLQGPYPSYTFIEPNYGDITSSYKNGSSQHPKDSIAGGEALIKYVYEAIRNSPVWNSSLLIITYDEHGGFYDHKTPAEAAPPPNDNPPGGGLNRYGFKFDTYGVRVPAVVISPYIQPGVNDTLFDHSSILATVENLFGFAPLTQRDAQASNLLHLLSPTLRTDCPTTLNNPATVAPQPPLTSAQQAAIDLEPLPEEGNLPGFLFIALKTEIELSSGSDAETAAIVANFNTLKTRGDAKQYITTVLTKVDAARAAAKANPAKPTGSKPTGS